VVVAVQDAGEGEAGGAASDDSDAMPHADTLYLVNTLHRNSTMDL
jgi:hypothetical protein